MKILRKVPCHSTVRITEFPFCSVNNKDLHSLALSSGSTNINNHASPTLKKIKKTKEFLKKFLEMNQIFDRSDNLISRDYYDIPEFKKMKIREQQELPILHLNISSISAHINDLRMFLNLFNQKIDIICISESRIFTKNPQTTWTYQVTSLNKPLLNPLLEGL